MHTLGLTQNHGKDCTEEFYRDHIRAVVALNADDEAPGVGDVLRMVTKQGLGSEHAIDGDGEGSGAGPSETDETAGDDEGAQSDELSEAAWAERSAALRRMALSDPACLAPAMLSAAERAQFFADVAAGHVVPEGALEWAPWWEATEAAHVAAARALAFPRVLEVETVAEIVPATLGTSAAGAANSTASSSSLELQESAGQGDETAEAVVDEVGGAGVSGALQRLPCVLPGSGSSGRTWLHSPACSALPPFSSLTSTPPAPALRFMLVELLLVYARVQRRWLGDCCDADAPAACAELLSLSPTLSDDRRYASVHEACSAAFEAGQAPGVRASPGSGRLGDALGALSDALKLLRCRHFVTDALWDTREIVLAALASLRADSVGGGPTLSAKTQRATSARGMAPVAGDASAARSPGDVRPAASKGGIHVLIAAERKLLFYCAWSASMLDALALRSLRADIVNFGQEMGSTWQQGEQLRAPSSGADPGLSGEAGASLAKAAAAGPIKGVRFGPTAA